MLSRRPLIIPLRLHIVTPMFISGADPERAEFRGGSLRGALRFWFRALHADGDEVGPAMKARVLPERKRDREPDRDPSVARLLRREALLFGSTSFAGCVRLVPRGSQTTSHTVSTQGADRLIPGPTRDGRPNRQYLWFTARRAGRGCLQPGDGHSGWVDLSLIVDPRLGGSASHVGWTEAEALRAIGETVVAWGTFGGLGLRARRAAGSFALESRTEEVSALRENACGAAIADGLNDLARSATTVELARSLVSRYSNREPARDTVGTPVAVMRKGVFQCGVWQQMPRGFDTWERATDELAGTYGQWRRTQSEGKYEQANFGLPFQYGKSRLPVNASVGRVKVNRRGSPLYFTLRRFGPEQRLAVVWCLFENRFLPEGATLQEGPHVAVEQRYDVVRGFLSDSKFHLPGEGAR